MLIRGTFKGAFDGRIEGEFVEDVGVPPVPPPEPPPPPVEEPPPGEEPPMGLTQLEQDTLTLLNGTIILPEGAAHPNESLEGIRLGIESLLTIMSTTTDTVAIAALQEAQGIRYTIQEGIEAAILKLQAEPRTPKNAYWAQFDLGAYAARQFLDLQRALTIGLFRTTIWALPQFSFPYMGTMWNVAYAWRKLDLAMLYITKLYGERHGDVL